MRKPLTRNQGNNVGAMVLMLLLACFVTGAGFLAYFSFRSSGPQHYCDGHTGVTVSKAGNQYTASISYNDPKC